MCYVQDTEVYKSDSLILKMEVGGSSEAFGAVYQITCCHIPEDHNYRTLVYCLLTVSAGCNIGGII
jgi:hypothetical protein